MPDAGVPVSLCQPACLRGRQPTSSILVGTRCRLYDPIADTSICLKSCRDACTVAAMARLVLAGVLLCGVGASPSAEECLELGFTDTLSCSQCAKMGEFVKDEALLADCKTCCVDDNEAATTYASAVLEVCS